MRIRGMIGLPAALVCLFMPSLALAHTGVTATSGFGHGFVHPLMGPDHLLAMVLVGLLGFEMGGRARYLLPLSFLSVMSLSAALGAAGIPSPFVELVIAASVVVLGLALALNIQMPLALAMGFAGLFAAFHGYAHGAEMPATADGIAYGLGFLAATALLHGAGLLAGLIISRLPDRRGSMALRSLGTLSVIAGVGLVSGVI